MSNIIGQRIGSYQIVGLLGKGGMANVYRAQQVLGGGVTREVALKLIDPRLSLTQEFLARFRREAQTLIFSAVGTLSPAIAVVKIVATLPPNTLTFTPVHTATIYFLPANNGGGGDTGGGSGGGTGGSPTPNGT